MLGKANSAARLAHDFGAGLSESEVDYLMREEWALEASDIVWRRSKLGLRLTSGQITALDRYMANKRAAV